MSEARGATETRSLRRSLAYLNWVFNPRHGLSTERVYDLLATTTSSERGMYINLGYWRVAGSIDEACDALAMRVADAGDMSSADTVVDCGFGFADQDLLWASRIGPKKIIGLNVTASQVGTARQRVTEAGLDDRIELVHGSATDMPLDDASADLVVALESAFHFQDREDFFRESFRVLRPGGRIVTADILPMPRADTSSRRFAQQLSWRLVASRFVIPPANAYGIDEYRRRLGRAGFEGIRIESIREQVYPPLHRFVRNSRAAIERLHPVARIPARLMLSQPPERVYAGLDYVLAAAKRPATG